MDWSTRRKPLGAIVAWSSLAIFAVLSILGIAGVVMGLQSRPAATQVEVAELAPAPVLPVDDRLPEELTFAEAAPADPSLVVTPAPPAEPGPDKGDNLIASTFDQLVEPVVVPASEVPEGAVAIIQPATGETAVADAGVELPMGKDKAALTARPRVPVDRNAAAWAIESEVPDADRNNRVALGYAAQPDDTVRVGDSSINVRSGPSPASKKLFALATGAEVDVTGKSGDWVAITDGENREGWVDASLLQSVQLGALPVIKAVPAAEPEAPNKTTNVRKVAGSGVTVRSGPGKSNKQLFNLSGGTQVTVLDDSKGWLKIKDTQGRTGWAYKSYIR